MFTKYPNHFISQDPSAPTSGSTVIHTLYDGDPISGTFLGPVSVRELVTPAVGQLTMAVIESSRLPLNAIAQVIVPFFLVMVFAINVFVLKTIYPLSRRRLPLMVYFVYLAVFDLLELTSRGIDSLMEAYSGVRLLTAVQFLSKSACQLLPMTYSAFKHIQATLLIGIAVDSWRFARAPVCFTARFRREWTLNLIILASALAITVDSQFLWTFELTLLESKILHERLVTNAYTCGFAPASNLSPPFLHYIWPLIDHIWGDILPCLTSLVSGAAIFLSVHLKRISMENDTNLPSLNGAKDVGKVEKEPNIAELIKLRWTMTIVCIVNGTFIIPRFVYYMIKYGLFSGYHTLQTGIFWHGGTPIFQHPALATVSDTIDRVKRLRKCEIYLEGVEFLIRYIVPLSSIVRALVLIWRVDSVKKKWLACWSHVHSVALSTFRFVRNYLVENLVRKTTNNRAENVPVQRDGGYTAYVYKTSLADTYNRASPIYAKNVIIPSNFFVKRINFDTQNQLPTQMSNYSRAHVVYTI